MRLDQYHPILLGLKQAEAAFERAASDWSGEDRRLLQSLRVLKAEILKRESGHPFESLSLGAEPPADASISGEKPIRVMVVDDEASVRTVVPMVLSTSDRIEVVGTARDGAEAVRRAILLSPDVVVMDVNMPVMDGIEATVLLKKLVAGTRVVIHTGNHDAFCRERAMAAGASAVLYKPVIREDLIAAVHRACDQPVPGGGRLAERANK